MGRQSGIEIQFGQARFVLDAMTYEEHVTSLISRYKSPYIEWLPREEYKAAKVFLSPRLLPEATTVEYPLFRIARPEDNPSYYVAMHEIGHAEQFCSKDPEIIRWCPDLMRTKIWPLWELDAWYWALQNAIAPPETETKELILDAMRGYMEARDECPRDKVPPSFRPYWCTETGEGLYRPVGDVDATGQIDC
jgi:hypothetical protein